MASKPGTGSNDFTITTPRLTLRSAVPSDAEAIYDLMSDQANFPHDDVEAGLSAGVYRERIGRWQKTAEEGRNAFKVVARRDTGELIGFGGFNALPRGPALDGSGREELVGDTGVVIDRRYWRQGYGREAFCATVDYGFETLGCGHFTVDTARENEEWRAFMRAVGLGGAEGRRDSRRNEGAWEYVYKFDRAAWERAKEEMKARGGWPL